MRSRLPLRMIAITTGFALGAALLPMLVIPTTKGDSCPCVSIPTHTIRPTKAPAEQLTSYAVPLTPTQTIRLVLFAAAMEKAQAASSSSAATPPVAPTPVVSASPTPTTTASTSPATSTTQPQVGYADERPDGDYSLDAETTDTSDWECIRIHEGGGTYNEFWSGAYGFLQSTAEAYGLGYPVSAGPAAQDAAALDIFHRNGNHFRGAWNGSPEACGLW